MGLKYDLESLLDDVKTVMTNNFNTVAAAINTEKNDGLTLYGLEAEAFFLQQLNGKMQNWKLCCLYGVDEIENFPNGPDVSCKFKLSVVLIVTDNGEEVECGKRMFRYSRALQETFRRGWVSNRGGVKLSVTSLVPIALPQLNSSETYRAVGVELEGNLG